MDNSGHDSVRLALEYVTRLAEVVETCRSQICSTEREKCKPGAGIARRANDLSNLVASAGLVPAMTFYMSKADGVLLVKVIDILNGGQVTSDFCEEAAEDLGGKEKAGYTSMLAIAAKGLTDLGYIDNPSNLRAGNGMKWLAEGLKKLKTNGNEIIAERRMLELLIEIKKLASAFFKQED